MRPGAAFAPFPDQSTHIGSIDFPMPEKTHSVSCRVAASLLLCGEVRFELRWRYVAERGVKPFLVIDLLEELADRGPRLGQIAVFVAMNLFVLQGLHEGFARRVIPWIRFARHTDVDAVFPEQIRVVAAGILRTTVGMMDQTRLHHPSRKRHS